MGFLELDNLSNYAVPKKTRFFDATPGSHIIRILDPKATIFKTHWVGKYRVSCLGDECPICKYKNESEVDEYPEVTALRLSFAVNILDRTQVKICPKCGNVIKARGYKFPDACTNESCGYVLAQVKSEPLNKVVVLTSGVRLFRDQLSEIYNQLGDLRLFDIRLTVAGTGRDRTMIAEPLPENNDEVKVPESEKYNLDEVPLELSADEIVSLWVDGKPLADIFRDRNKKQSDEKSNTSISNKFLDSFFD